MTLPKDVAEAMALLDSYWPGIPDAAWVDVRAHLLSLARENAELHKSALGGHEDGRHALRNERDALKAELAKLKARIAEAPVVTVCRQIDTSGDGDTGKLPPRDDLPADYIGKRVALVKLEDEG